MPGGESLVMEFSIANKLFKYPSKVGNAYSIHGITQFAGQFHHLFTKLGRFLGASHARCVQLHVSEVAPDVAGIATENARVPAGHKEPGGRAVNGGPGFGESWVEGEIHGI